MASKTLRCRDLIDILDAYLDDDLSAAEQSRFEAHLAICPDCVAYLESYRDTVRLGSVAFDPDAGIPADVPEVLIRAVLEARRR